MLSIWLTVLLAGLRCLAVGFPLHVERWLTLSRVRRITMVLIIAVTWFHIPATTSFYDLCCCKPYSILFSAASVTMVFTAHLFWHQGQLRDILHNILPLISLTCFNVALVIMYQRSKKLPTNNRACSQADRQITLVAIVVVAVFIFCQLPEAITVNIVMFLTHKYGYPGVFDTPPDLNSSYFFMFFLQVLVALNCVANVPIYCAFRQQFREKLFDIF